MLEPYQRDRSAVAMKCGLFVTALLAVLVSPTSVLAQSVCDSISQLPPREEGVGQRQLAVWIDDRWQFKRPNADMPAYRLEIERLDQLCLAWEAPSYRSANRQIVYVSTRHKDDQPLSLFRNSAAAAVPLLWRLFNNWTRPPGSSDRGTFRVFHGDRELAAGVDATSQDNLTRWHDTSAWLANSPSHDLVSGAVADATTLPYGAERLLTLRGGRPRTSWVSFDTYTPSAGGELRVAVAYSGDLDNLGLRVYLYVFQAGG